MIMRSGAPGSVIKFLFRMGFPCFKILDCWHSHFQVEKFLREQLTPEEWEKVFKRQLKPKVLTLVEMIEQAKRRQDP
jgi:hypothetical protein